MDYELNWWLQVELAKLSVFPGIYHGWVDSSLRWGSQLKRSNTIDSAMSSFIDRSIVAGRAYAYLPSQNDTLGVKPFTLQYTRMVYLISQSIQKEDGRYRCMRIG